MFKDSDKWVIEGNVQDNLMCVATFQRRRLENVSLRVEVFLPKKRSKVWRRFEVSIDALRFGCERGKLFNVADLKTFLEGGGFSKETLKGLTTLWGFYQRFEVSIEALRFLSTLCGFAVCGVNFSTSKTWKRFFEGGGFSSKETLKGLATL